MGYNIMEQKRCFLAEFSMRISLILAFLALISALSANALLETYKNNEYHFSFQPPAGWKSLSYPDTIAVFMEKNAPGSLSGKKKLMAHAVISIMSRKCTDLNIMQYAKQTRHDAAHLKEYRIIGESNGKLGGASAIFRIVRLYFPGEPIRQTREVYCIKNKTLFSIVLAAPREQFDYYKKLFDHSLASFKWF
jgi:hypothetical protein